MPSFIHRDLPSAQTPLEVFRLLSGREGCFFLDSSLQPSAAACFSVLGAVPVETWRGHTLGEMESFTARILDLSSNFQGIRAACPYGPGAVGGLSYDLGRSWEDVQTRHPDTGWPLFHFGIYDAVYVYDHAQRRAWISAHSEAAADRMFALLQPGIRDNAAVPFSADGGWRGHEQDKDGYERMVVSALEAIAAGDIYQINLTRRVTRSVPRPFTRDEAAAVFERLRRHSPSPWGGYFDAGDFQLLSSSPELFLEMRGEIARTRPMKGTRPRGRTSGEDQALRRELECSAKEQAELVMVTDLERNDLGKVCRTGTVRVSGLREIEEYATVFQGVSSVEGRLVTGVQWPQLLKAMLPGGSVSGCPKRRALELIDSLEGSGRGFYTGAFGHIGLDGNMTLNMLIRTLFLRGSEIVYGVGSGIVADSDPAAEFDETVLKARGMDEVL